MKIIWHGHSCFEIVTEIGSVVLDPYGDHKVPGYGKLKLKADMVLCSHEHGDHNAVDVVELTGKKCGIQVMRIDSFHDEDKGAKRGRNTIHILSSDGLRVAHLGDLGCQLDTDQINELKGVDVLMIPIGGYYTINTAQALTIISQINPRITIPMHYRDGRFGYNEISTIEEFREKCFHPVKYGNMITVDAETERQTALMTSDKAG